MLHPRRPRSSQSGRVKRRDESFQAWVEEPLGTDSQRTISKRSSDCRLLIGHKKCFVLLCPIRANSILGDPGGVSRDGRKGGTKGFKYGRKSPWVPTLTRPFPKIQADTSSWLGTKNALYDCAQSGNTSPEFFSCVRTRRLLSRSRLVWLVHQRNARSQETFSLI